MTDRDVQAQACRATGSLQTTLQGLDKCRSSVEKAQAESIVSATTDVQGAMDAMIRKYTDVLYVGDQLLGAGPNSTYIEDIQARNAELRKKVAELEERMREHEERAERANQTFVDEKVAAPSPLATPTLNVVEDYTVMLAIVAYFLLAMVLTYAYVAWSGYSLRGMAEGLAGGVLVTIVVLSVSSYFV